MKCPHRGVKIMYRVHCYVSHIVIPHTFIAKINCVESAFIINLKLCYVV